MMKKTLNTFFVAIAVILFACSPEEKKETQKDAHNRVETMTDVDDDETLFDFSDNGGEISLFDIEKYTMKNDNFRTTVWTGDNIQMTLMSIPVDGEIGHEIHTNIEQFIRIESGKGLVIMGDTEDDQSFRQEIHADEVVFIPKGKWHNIKNIGDKPLKLYSIYGPTEHPKGTIHVTMEEGHEHDH